MYHFNLYKAESNWYMRLVHVASGKIWDNTNNILADNPAWSNTAIALTFNSYIGGHPITLPSDLPQGDYDVLFYDAATPASSDAVLKSNRIRWSGNNLGYPVYQMLDI